MKRTGRKQRTPIDLYGVRSQYTGVLTTGYNVAWVCISSSGLLLTLTLMDLDSSDRDLFHWPGAEQDFRGFPWSWIDFFRWPALVGFLHPLLAMHPWTSFLTSLSLNVCVSEGDPKTYDTG